MAIVVASSPAFPTLGALTTLSATGTAGAFQTWQLTSVPAASALAVGVAFKGATFTPDVAGAYGIQCNDFVQFNAPPQFPGDATGGLARTICQQTGSGTVYCVDSLTLPIVTTTGHAITLTLGVGNASVQTATLTSPSSALASQCALDATVKTKLAALLTVSVSAIDDDLATSSNALRIAYEAHRLVGGAGSVHVVADTTSVTRAEAATVGTNDTAIKLYASLYDTIGAHMVQGSGGGAWHSVDDTKNVPIAVRPTTLAACTVAAADLRYRVYNRHRVQIASPASHLSADNTNTLAAIKPLPDLICTVLDFFATNSPTSPTGANPGTTRAVGQFGFRS